MPPTEPSPAQTGNISRQLHTFKISWRISLAQHWDFCCNLSQCLCNTRDRFSSVGARELWHSLTSSPLTLGSGRLWHPSHAVQMGLLVQCWGLDWRIAPQAWSCWSAHIPGLYTALVSDIWKKQQNCPEWRRVDDDTDRAMGSPSACSPRSLENRSKKPRGAVDCNYTDG